MNSLQLRSITGFFYVVVMTLGMLSPLPFYILLLSILHAGIWLEYVRLSDQASTSKKHSTIFFHLCSLIVVGQGMLLLGSQAYLPATSISTFSVGCILLGISFVALVIGYMFSPKLVLRESISRDFIGIVWISVPLCLLVYLRESTIFTDVFHRAEIAPLCFFVCIWVNDTFAYIVGSLIGKTKLSKVSPKKTWEGTLGGIAVTMLVCGSLYNYFGWVNGIHAYVMPLLVGVFGTIGDLLESALKRKAHVKDSGHILPGHGGLFDRLDSALIAATAVMIYLAIFLLSPSS